MAEAVDLPIPSPPNPDLAYRALRRCAVTIANSNLNPIALATSLFSEELIPEILHRNIKDVHSNRNSSERIEDMMECVRERCKHQGKDFKTFIDIVYELGERDLANKVIERYRGTLYRRYTCVCKPTLSGILCYYTVHVYTCTCSI